MEYVSFAVIFLKIKKEKNVLNFDINNIETCVCGKQTQVRSFSYTTIHIFDASNYIDLKCERDIFVWKGPCH